MIEEINAFMAHMLDGGWASDFKGSEDFLKFVSLDYVEAMDSSLEFADYMDHVIKEVHRCMEFWEYKKILVEGNDLNVWGRLGWELCCIEGNCYHMKRRVIP